MLLSTRATSVETNIIIQLAFLAMYEHTHTPLPEVSQIVKSNLLSSLALCESPRVHAKIEARGERKRSNT